MKKDHTRDYAVAAFRLYASQGCPSYEEAEERIKQEIFKEYSALEPQRILMRAEMAVKCRATELADIAAVDGMLTFLKKNGKSYIVEAVEAVYFKYPTRPISKGEINDRVIKLSVTMPASTQAIYKWLREARQLFAAIRGLRIE